MAEHLGYEPHDPAGSGSGNSHNGTTTTVVHIDVGPVELEVPRDRNGEFAPIIVPKHVRRLSDFDEAIVSLYEVARTLRVSSNAVRRWRRRFEAEGADGVGVIAPGRSLFPDASTEHSVLERVRGYHGGGLVGRARYRLAGA
jgi:transposase-like protein